MNNRTDRQEKTLRLLQTVGMSCFVEHFDKFSVPNPNKEALIKTLTSATVTESSARTKVNTGIRIVREGRHRDALLNIVEASRIPASVRSRAQALLNDFKSN